MEQETMNQKSVVQNTGNPYQKVKSEFEISIVHLMRVMLADFPAQYRKAHPNKQAAKEFKSRLMVKLSGFGSQAIVNGYELQIEIDTKFMPSIPDLTRSISQAHADIKKNNRLKAEAEAIALMPPDEEVIITNPLRLLSEALKNHKEPENETSQERPARRANMLQDHEKLISGYKNKGKIHYLKDDGKHNCVVNGCFNHGIRSNGVKGSEYYYCSSHIHKTM